MNAHNEQAAAAQEAVAWVKAKPTAEGDYYVRGFNLFAPKQYEALVQVRMHHFEGEPAPELVCNLHESTSNDDMGDWSPIVEMSDDFEWRGPLFASPTPAAPAEFDRARETPRRQRAVELLLSMGYQWRDDEWVAPSTPAAPGIDLAELAELLRIWQCHFDSGVRPDEEDEPEDAALWDRIKRIRDAAMQAQASDAEVQP